MNTAAQTSLPDTPTITRATEGTTLSILGDSVRVLLSPEQSGGKYLIIEQTANPGGGVPLHVHEDEDETFFITAGQVQFSVDGKEIVAKAGDLVYGPRRVPHSWLAIGTETVHVVISITPGRMHQMFQELSQVMFPPDFAKVAEICGRYNITFLR